jgi:hypothetical protein
LDKSNVVSWDLTIGLAGTGYVDLNEDNSVFELSGPQVIATEDELKFAAASGTILDFSNKDGRSAFFYIAQAIDYRYNLGGDEAIGYRQGPGTLTMSRYFTEDPAPEPATSALMLVSTALLFPVLKRINRFKIRKLL